METVKEIANDSYFSNEITTFKIRHSLNFVKVNH